MTARPVDVVNISYESMHKGNLWRFFLKRSFQLMFKFDVYFRNIEVINYFPLENSFGDLVSYTPQFKHKNNQKASCYCAERCWMLYVPM